MLKVVAKNYADLQCLDKILDLFKELVEITRHEPGCISYGLYQDTDRPELLTMIEEWESREALEDHLHSVHFTRIVPQLGKLMTRETDMNVYCQLI